MVEGIDAPGQQSNFPLNLGIVHTEDHEFDAAFGYFDRVLEIYRAHHDRRGEADVLVKLAEAHRLSGSESEALETAAQALEIARLAKTRLTEGEAFWRLGDVHADRGDMELARAYWRDALAVLEGIGRIDPVEARALLDQQPRPTVPDTYR